MENCSARCFLSPGLKTLAGNASNKASNTLFERGAEIRQSIWLFSWVTSKVSSLQHVDSNCASTRLSCKVAGVEGRVQHTTEFSRHTFIVFSLNRFLKWTSLAPIWSAFRLQLKCSAWLVSSPQQVHVDMSNTCNTRNKKIKQRCHLYWQMSDHSEVRNTCHRKWKAHE